MTPITRKDIQTIVDTARNQIFQRTASRQEVQATMENARDRILSYLRDFLIQNQQQFFRQLETRNAQYTQRLTTMESHIAALENELRTMRQQMTRMAGQKQQPIIMPMPAEQKREAQPQPQPAQYTYNPYAA